MKRDGITYPTRRLVDFEKAVVMCQSPAPRLLSLRDASRYLSLSIPTIRNLISSGRLAVVRSSQRAKLLVDIHELESFCTRTTHSPVGQCGAAPFEGDPIARLNCGSFPSRSP
jgi:hypothetical protein